MTDFSLTIAVGLGDCIFSWAALDAVKHRYDHIYVNSNWSIIKAYKHNSKEYRQFITQLMQLIFTDPRFVLHTDRKCPVTTMTNLWVKKIPPVIPRIPSLCKKHDKTPQKPYIVVTTKVREYRREHFNKVKKSLVTTLRELSKKYQIVLIGEREVEMNVEYKIYGSDSIYSIYDEIVSGVEVVDLTIPKLGIVAPNLDTLQKDCGLMRDAKGVVTVGGGGNLVLATATAGNLVGIRKDSYQFMDRIYKKVTNNICVTNDQEQFIERLKSM